MISTRQFLSITALSAALGASLLVSTAFAQNAVIVNGKSIPKAQLDKLVEKSGQADNPQIRDQAREV